MSEERVCEICGKTFIPNSPSQKLCGSAECFRARRREYAQKHADMYREAKKKYRKRPEVKKHMAQYDKLYQVEHKDQIREYKKIWFQKQQFYKKLENGVLLKNIYWYSLSEEEQAKIFEENNITNEIEHEIKTVYYSKRSKNKNRVKSVKKNTDKQEFEDDEPKLTPQEHFEKAQNYWMDENGEAAIKEYSKAIELKPDFFEAYFERAEINMHIENYKNAIEDYSKYIEINGENPYAYYKQAIAYEKIGELEEALDDYRIAWELAPNEEKYLRAFEDIIEKEGTFKSIINCYTYIIKQFPKYIEAYYYRGKLYYEDECFDEAIKDYTTAIKKGYEHPEVYADKGVVYHYIEDFKNASENFEKALEFGFDEETNASCSLEDLYYFLYDEYLALFDEYKSEIENCNNDDENLIEKLNQLICVYEKIKKLPCDYKDKEGVGYAYKDLIVRVDRKAKEMYYKKAIILYNSKDYKNAIVELSRAIQIDFFKIEDDLRGDLYYQLGLCYFETEKYVDAYKAFKNAYTENPNDTEAKKYANLCLEKMEL